MNTPDMGATDPQASDGQALDRIVADRALHDFIADRRQLFVLTGAGISTESGIPDYRDATGAWKRPPPISYQAFVGDATARQRYWARSMVGWRRFGSARPSRSHYALAALEAQGRISLLLTQNVDGLHQQAGQREVIDLHGRLDRVRCLGCDALTERAALQSELVARNPAWADAQAAEAPDGDADLEAADFSAFQVPACLHCGGVLKPDVVFFGENVPAARVARANALLAQSEAMLVLGSSLMVFSGYRFVLAAARRGLPVAAVNLGHTRADALLTLKIERGCGEVWRAPPQTSAFVG